MHYKRLLSFTLLIVLTVTGCGTSVRDRWYSDDTKIRRSPAGKLSITEIKKLPPHIKENWRNYKIGTPYRVMGKWYFPKENPDYSEVGLASWYGPGFHNKLTGNGEVFDQHVASAAHRTLPMPSMVRVTNLENGRTALIRVNDRGPFVKDHERILDLSMQAAKELGIYKKGTGKVRVEFDKEATAKLFYDEHTGKTSKPFAVRPKHLTSPRRGMAELPPTPKLGYFIQVGAYSVEENARVVKDVLRDIAPLRVKEVSMNGKLLYRVQLGPVKKLEKVDEIRERMAELGFSDAIIVAE